MTNPAVVSGGAQGDYQAGTSTPSMAAATHNAPRLAGCPLGCTGHCEHDVRIVPRCWYCTSLSISARESLDTCESVCLLLVDEPS
jgi:hypothetical protein